MLIKNQINRNGKRLNTYIYQDYFINSPPSKPAMRGAHYDKKTSFTVLPADSHCRVL